MKSFNWLEVCGPFTDLLCNETYGTVNNEWWNDQQVLVS